MEKKTAETASRPPSRLRVIGLGALLGGAWGAVMWGIFTLAGRDADGRMLAYLVVSTAMIGCGVAAFFGANEVRRRGERVTPRFRLPFRRR
jgi:hypothetical protein